MIEGHPIPQDITGFQFRLIGDMTVKQFAYVIVGLVIGWILFSMPIYLFIKLPLAAGAVLSGIIFAFVPVQGVPADTLFLLFFKALFSPNQYVYQKQGNITATTQPGQNVSSETAQIVGMTPAATPKNASQTIPATTKPSLASFPQTTTSAQSTAAPKTEVIFKETKKAVLSQPVIQRKEQPSPSMQQTTPPVPQTLPSAPIPPSSLPAAQVTTPSPNPFEKQLQDILKQKEELEHQLKQLTQQQTAPAVSVPQPQETTQKIDSVTPPKVPENPYKKVTNQPKKNVAPASFMPEVPNLIAGIVKDPRGNVLPNILVEVKDKDDNPVRAFKTNALGQFISATQLLNGTYTILFEDPKKQQRFDTIELTADGTILPPLEIISIDEREDLRKSLFNT